MSLNPSAVLPTNPNPAIDFSAIKQRQQATWASGDYGNIGTRLQIVGEQLTEALDLRAGEQVLDVAAGNGNASIAAARRYANVTSTDYVPELLFQGEARAKANGLKIKFQVADAEALPFHDGEYDVAMSTFGVMFAPNQPQAANELIRVVRSGGRIGLSNWTPEGFIGQLFRLLGRYITPPAGVQSPMLWGSEPHIVKLFGSQATEIRCLRRMYNFRFQSAAHWIEVFRTYYGPINKAYGALDAQSQRQLTDEIADLLGHMNIAAHDSLVVPSEYMEVVITRK